MPDTNGFAERVQELARRFKVECTIPDEGLPILALENIPVKGYRVYEEFQGRMQQVMMGREPALPIVRLYLSSLAEIGTARVTITEDVVHHVADFFGQQWVNALTGENLFLFNIHIGSYIELDWT